MIAKGKRDEMNLRQPNYAPDLVIRDIIQYLFGYLDNNNEDKETLKQSTSMITKISNRTNLLNDKGRYYHKDGAVEVQQYADDNKGKEISFLVIEIKKLVFNYYIEFEQRMFFNMYLILKKIVVV